MSYKNSLKKLSVEDACELVSVGIVIQPAQYYTDEVCGIKAFRSANVGCGRINDRNWVYISQEGHNKNKKSKLQTGDVLVVRSGAPGTSCVVSNEFAGSNCIDIVFARPKKHIVLPEYLCLFTNSDIGKRQIEAAQGGLALKHFNVGAYKKLVIDIPGIKEQTAIASLLSTWDIAIEKVERLSAAKEKRFTSLTQELIHNCTEGLQHIHLRDVCEPVTRKNSINELNVLTTSAQHGLISQMDYYKKSVSAEDVRGYYLLKNGEFAYNRSSSNGYPYGAIKRLDGYPQGVLSTLYLCFSLKKDALCDADFMAHAFEAGLLNKQLVGVCQEGARSHGLLNITKTDFFGLKMALPPIEKQKQIAAILSTARQEIDLLKKQADAYRRQKRGLMQRLLTGEWRVRVG